MAEELETKVKNTSMRNWYLASKTLSGFGIGAIGGLLCSLGLDLDPAVGAGAGAGVLSYLTYRDAKKYLD
jgi:hypothetical protein